MRKWLIASAVFIVLMIVFLPKIASTSLGKSLFAKAFSRKSHAHVEIGSLHLSWFGPQQFRDLKWEREAVTGTVEELNISTPFWSFSGPFKLKNGSIAYKGGNVEQIQGQMEGNDFTLTGITLQGRLSMKGQIYSKLHFHIQVDVKQFPLIVIGQQFDQLLGPTLNLNGTVSLDEGKGTIDLVVNAANLNTRIKGILTEYSVTLHEPLIAALRLTPEMSALLLKDANPLFLTGVAAENPITLRIEPKGFYFPLPFSLERLKVDQATLSLGQVKCQNGKSLKTIIALLKADRFSSASEMDAWFTPVALRIDQGILDAGRMDALLADSIHICTWGRIDLLRDQIDMYLGIPADTLQESFGIKNLPDHYVLKIPVRGTTKDPDIVKGPAAAKIAALIAAGQISQKPFLGGWGGLISKPKDEKDVPPANHPFPWE